MVCLFVTCLLFGCTPMQKEKSKIVILKHDPIPEELLDQIQKTMPETVCNELKKRGECKRIDETLRVMSGEHTAQFDYALCLDYSHDKNGTLTGFVYKPYTDGTFDDGTLHYDNIIGKEGAIKLADKFARAFFDEKREFSSSGRFKWL